MVVEESHEEVAGGLGGPRAGRVCGDPGEMHPPGSHLDNEQHVKPAQSCGVDASEVGGDDPSGLGSDELHPRRTGAIR